MLGTKLPKALPVALTKRRQRGGSQLLSWGLAVVFPVGERNDLKVRVELFVTGIDLEDSYEIYHTDVHMFAKTTATYNWRIVKKIRLPLAALSLRVRPLLGSLSLAFICVSVYLSVYACARVST